jgi:hypothetical protein
LFYFQESKQQRIERKRKAYKKKNKQKHFQPSTKKIKETKEKNENS